MKIDGILNHKKEGISAYGITESRADEINDFIDKIFDQAKSETGIRRSEVLEKVITFANSTVEACIMFGWVEHRMADAIAAGIGTFEVSDPDIGNDVLTK